MEKAILFLNGTPPKTFDDKLEKDAIIACTDGAFEYLKDTIGIQKIHFISGDFDSYELAPQHQGLEVIHTPDQDYTDFHKALNILKSRGVKEIKVYGASGDEQDHFLGNLTVAYHFKDTLDIIFEDEYARYFFIPNTFKLQGVQNKMISLYPFPYAKEVTTKGLKWLLNGEDLEITHRIGTRNIAIEDTVTIEYNSGGLLVFVGH
ncbi:thiamine diphosphokinase [Riemerella columbina]|uniref:thiamine diphosphokinase n=1 Tax=Riemerella columbina TaxID=103810 RepID=UPI00037D6CD1|nr:thiamine diphosphokinase [Riemerella columbina]